MLRLREKGLLKQSIDTLQTNVAYHLFHNKSHLQISDLNVFSLPGNEMCVLFCPLSGGAWPVLGVSFDKALIRI